MKDRSRAFGIAVAATLLGLGVAWFGLRAAEPARPAPANAPARAAPLQDADTIHDDPTVAPDPKQSADKDVSLPADI